MEPQIEQKKNLFLSRLSPLLEDVKQWLGEIPLKVVQEKMTIEEEQTGKYEVDALKIQDSSKKKIASLVPVGAWILLAEGRVDLIGDFDEENFVFMEEGGPRYMSTRSKKGGPIEVPLYKGVDQDGWYWVEDKKRRKAHRLEKELFFEILREVSDYEF